MKLSVKTKNRAAARKWASRNAIACPGVTYTILQNGRRQSYRYEDGLMYCTGHNRRWKPYRLGFGRLTPPPSIC